MFLPIVNTRLAFKVFTAAFTPFSNMSLYKSCRVSLALVGMTMTVVMAQQGLGEQCKFFFEFFDPTSDFNPPFLFLSSFNYGSSLHRLTGGGLNYTGATTCTSGATCVYVSDGKL